MLGRHAEGGGRFVRFGDENKAYRVRLSAWLDTTPRNWADSALVSLEPEQVAKVEIGFAGEAHGPVVATRATAEEPFASAQAPAGQQLRQSTVNSLLSTISNLRFTDTTTPEDPDAAAARQHQRSVTVTTFDGESVTVALGRKPEQRVTKKPEPESEKSGPAAVVGTVTETPKPDDAGPAKVTEDVTETIPAGPVFASVSGAPELAKLASAADGLSFKVSDHSFTSLPQAPTDLFEPAPEPVTEEASASDAPEPKDEGPSP